MPVTLQSGRHWCGEQGGSIRILEWIGEGSYARVYRAQGASGEVAVKLAKAEVNGAEERLRQERGAHSVLKHPAIPCLVDEGRAGPAEGSETGAAWIARRWVEGDTLSRRLEPGRSLPLIHVVPLLLRIVEAIAAIHRSGWTHGDVRPHNVLLETGTNLAFL